MVIIEFNYTLSCFPITKYVYCMVFHIFQNNAWHLLLSIVTPYGFAYPLPPYLNDLWGLQVGSGIFGGVRHRVS